MAENVFLNSYVVRVKKKFSRKSDPLDNFENGKDLYSILKPVFEDMRNKYFDNQEAKKTNLISDCQTDDTARLIFGTIKTGEYGFVRDTLDTVSKKTGVIPKEQSVLLPCYFLLSLPKNTRKGIALFGQYKKATALGTVDKIIQNFMDNNHKDYKCDIDPLYPQDQVERILNQGVLRAISFIRHQIPRELEDQVAADGTEEIRGETNLVVKIRNSSLRERIYEKIMDFLNREEDIKTLYEFPAFDYSEIRATISLGGRKREVNLTDLRKIRINYDISSSVAIEVDGNPSFSSLHSNALSLLSDLRAQLGE